jgi:outer membrane protein
MLCKSNNVFLFLTIAAPFAFAQTPPPQNLPKLTLQQAEALAIQNHPQVQAAQNEINYSNQQIVESRAAFYPNVTGDLTGSQGNNLARIGAGDLSASRLFNRFGQGVVVRQLITDSGRTSNLVSSSRLQAQATAQTAQATRYDVLLQVNRTYFDVLHAQAVVKVAEQTVSARQLLSDQVTELARNSLKSQLDVSFAEVNVSQSKLLLVRAQDSVQQALAELGRAMGSDKTEGG